MNVEDIIFDVAEALRVPVLVLAVLALVVVLVEFGSLLVELRRRRRRGLPRLERGLDAARAALAAGDANGALRAVRSLGFNRAMSDALAAIVEQGGYPDADDRIAKRMAEYDYRSLKRLERTRILVRAGPALGLMGTLIPLSPALAALAEGDIGELTTELRVAFSVTVAGLLIGMVAFAVSLIRDRLYAQDFSDVEYVQAALAGKIPAATASGAGTVPQTSPRPPAAQPTVASQAAVTPSISSVGSGDRPVSPSVPAPQPPPVPPAPAPVRAAPAPPMPPAPAPPAPPPGNAATPSEGTAPAGEGPDSREPQ